MVATFIQSEEQNFKMFKFVNSQSDEIEFLNQQIEDMRLELKKYIGKGIVISDDKWKELKELEEKLSKTELWAEQFELEYQQAIKWVNGIKSRIEALFNLLECDEDDPSELLGNAGVTESNLMVYLGLIEMKVTEMLQCYAIMKQEMIRRERGKNDEDPYFEQL